MKTSKQVAKREDEDDQMDQQDRNMKQLPTWILFWFYTTAIICTWDATFIMLRPYTLPGGSLAPIWYLYKYYVNVDQRYLDTGDAYVFAQSLLNYGEVVFNVITIVMHYHKSRHTVTTAFMVTVMTMWKTILYFLMFSEFCTGGMYREGNTAMEEFILVVIPNGVWVVAPLAAMYVLWEQLTPVDGGQGQLRVTGKPQGHAINATGVKDAGQAKVGDGDKNDSDTVISNGIVYKYNVRENSMNGMAERRKVK